jgi:hypothetical protein
MRGRLELCVRYRGFVKHSDTTGLFLSWCPMLDIKSQGRTSEEAREALDDSVRLFVVHCFRRGILEEVLKECGLEERPSEESDGDGEADDCGESVSLRSIPAEPESLDSWEGQVPLHLVAVAENRRVSEDGSWRA